MSHWRAALRLARMLAHALRGLWIVWVHFPRLGAAARAQHVQRWAQQLLRTLGIGLHVTGQPCAAGPALLVANHISWLDIPVLHAARFCRFIAKDDIRHWPLVGRLATAADTLYIARASRKDAQRMVHTMAERLRHGDVLAVFPEGTTGDGLSVLPFHANLLESAVRADAPVQPVALRFIAGADGAVTTAPSYAGETTLMQSVWRTLRAEQLVVQVHFGVPERPAGRDRRALSAELRARIAALAQLPH